MHTLLFLEHLSRDYKSYGSPLIHSITSVYNCQNLFFIHLYLENFAFLHTRYQVLDFCIVRYIEVLHAWGLNLCLQPKEWKKWGQTIWYQGPMESAPGLQSIWQQTLLRIDFGSESVLQLLCNNRIRQS